MKTSTILITAGVMAALYFFNRNQGCGPYLSSQSTPATMYLGGSAALLGLGAASWIIDRSKL